ncbi:Rv3654c family TadE-like protein [Cellulomonas cellasea]|uniref:Putative Flp pilus-assembly TadG-like N-terminal domain-containing protein n=2 Tax=Cellulomonas cellasea TaxID=43670 RepID=A0A0A0B5H4_9CELL|nr:Rv3654c family TadE-like protein [Cellulomonas cellasea]KGM02100.1 hypothetical protein Q760_15520 [Cellulomonas cellasea DSM 20118]GEA86468.1 hypothetical protein CCE01nite_04170 [Cellulomonas cellasea]
MGRGVRRGRPDESGSGTVLVLGVVAVAGALLAVVALLVGAQGARGRAQAGADLAALAAAQHLLDHGGAAEACEIAQAVARRNDVRLVSCSDTGSGVVAVSTVRASAAGPATARARAGPVSARS